MTPKSRIKFSDKNKCCEKEKPLVFSDLEAGEIFMWVDGELTSAECSWKIKTDRRSYAYLYDGDLHQANDTNSEWKVIRVYLQMSEIK